MSDDGEGDFLSPHPVKIDEGDCFLLCEAWQPVLYMQWALHKCLSGTGLIYNLGLPGFYSN